VNVVLIYLLTYLIRSSYTLRYRGCFFHFDHFTDGRTPWTSDQLVAMPLPKHRTTQTHNKQVHIQISMPYVEFEPTFSASERACSYNLPKKTLSLRRQAFLPTVKNRKYRSARFNTKITYTKNSSQEKLLGKNFWMISRRRGISWEHNVTYVISFC
jgi:hypothetical protein